MGIAITELTPFEQTALVTQYGRALDSRWPRPILGDTLADEIVAKIDYDFPALGVPSSAVRQTALRAKMLDERVRGFIAEHPDAVVVALGAGLDTGMLRSSHRPRWTGTTSICRTSSHCAMNSCPLIAGGRLVSGRRPGVDSTDGDDQGRRAHGAGAGLSLLRPQRR